MARNQNTAKGIKSGLTPAQSRKVNKALRDLPDRFLECRSYRYHSLERLRIFHWNDIVGKGMCRISRCVRCGTIREDYYSSKGVLVDRRYENPPGYSLRGLGHLPSHKVMQEVFARATDIAASTDDAKALVRHLATAPDAS